MAHGTLVEECFSWGNQVIGRTTNQSIGGITGGQSYQSPLAIVRNCFSRENQLSSERQSVGGITGYNDGYIVNCYSAGNTMTAPYLRGGLAGVGTATGNGAITHSYSDNSNIPSAQAGRYTGRWVNTKIPAYSTSGFDITPYTISSLGWDTAIWSTGPDGYPWLTGFNLPPVANAGAAQSVPLGSTARLDASATTDDHTPLTLHDYSWSVETAPDGSSAALSLEDTPYPMLAPDLAGEYTVRLTVTDENGATAEDTTTIVSAPLVAGGSFENGLDGWNATGTVTPQSGPPYESTDGIGLISFNDGDMTPDGVISQELPTTPGMSYQLSFDVGVLAYNTKRQALGMEVTNGSVFLSDTIRLRGTGGGNVDWISKTFIFTPDSPSITLTFTDLSTETKSIDLLLDNVRLTSRALSLLVTSEPAPGVAIMASPTDPTGNADGTTVFERLYNPGTTVTLTAPDTHGTASFFNWLKDGAHLSIDPKVELTMDEQRLMTAVYWDGEPIITAQPSDAHALDGGATQFEVVASGGVPLAYQWSFNGTQLAGANSATLAIDPVRPADAGTYTVTVSNSHGIVTSDTADLTVGASFPGLVNGSFESDFLGWSATGNTTIKSLPPYETTDGVKTAAFNAGNTTPDGVVSQTILTTPGQPYMLSFDMGVLAYNTSLQSLLVEVTGSPSLLAETFELRGSGNGNVVWRSLDLPFTADSASTTIAFSDVSPATNSLDLLLDRVRVTPSIVRTLTIESSPLAIKPTEIWLSPPDLVGTDYAHTDFSATYEDGSLVTITAPASITTSWYPVKGVEYRFVKWTLDGADFSTDPAVTLAMDADHTLHAEFALAPLYISAQPEDISAGIGEWAGFSVRAAGGVGTLTYQWKFNGTDIPGATDSQYSILEVSSADAGDYTVTVTDGATTVTSDPATLTVITTKLVNGGFEDGFTGWNHAGNVRVQNAAPAAEGSKVAGFNFGNTNPGGSVSQSFATTPGTTYRLTYAVGVLSYNTSLQTLEVEVVNSGTLASAVHTIRGLGWGTTKWENQSLDFTADDSATTVTFRDVSSSTNSIDLLLDNVRLEMLQDPVL
ncbi:MAG: DUF642 domain-containing protein [Verrucomicrobiales bacterium]